MKSIKPGRGPSIQGAVAGIAAAVFGIFWTIFSINLGAPFIFPIFGIVFIGLAVFQAVYNLKTDFRFSILLMKMRSRIRSTSCFPKTKPTIFRMKAEKRRGTARTAAPALMSDLNSARSAEKNFQDRRLDNV